ncbi:MAG: aromatic ring-hydroxylating dioxygenase subunit alpha [Acidimicrobiales bacterium]|nr:aromatic ring-hydroxylating dioxygenase subunit alpha [Acidimicrobiales bacterium]
MSVFDDELLASFEESVQPVDEARLLPPDLYRSQEWYDFEKEAIFLKDWLCVGRSDQIPEPGDYRTLTLFGEPLIIARDKEGQVNVMSAVCQHRGMVVADDSGNCNRFTCPYHHWAYGLDGELLGTPAMDRAVGFDKADYPLPRLAVELWQGFIFVSFGPDPRPLAPSLTKIDAILENYGLENTKTLDGRTHADLPWNWKIMMENFNDPYHASRLHGPLQTFAPSHMNDFLEWDDEDNAIGRIQHFTEKDGSFNPMKRAMFPVFEGLTDEDRMRGSFVLIPPTLALAIVPDEVAYFIIDPTGPESITIHIGYCFEQAALDDPMFEFLFDAADRGVENFNIQDLYADEMTQKGLRSVFAPRGRYSWQEETLQQFNRWLVKRYRESWPGGVR